MDFSFNETQQEVQGLAAQILGDQATPARLGEVESTGYRLDEALWQQLAEAGLLGVAFDEANGGMGFGFTELCLLCEEVGRTVAAVPVVPALVSAGLPIHRFGSDALKQRYLPGLAAGEHLLTAALAESLSEDPAAPQTRATAADDGWTVSGTKICVPLADRAKRVLLTARTDDGVVVLLVDPEADGVTLNAQIATTREPWFEMVLDNTAVPAAEVLAGPADGAAVARWLTERSMAAYCAMQTGVAEKSLSMTAEYTCERIQFDVPIGSFQAVQHRAADCYIDVNCLKLTTYQAVSLLDAESDARNEVLIAKIWAGDCGHRVSYAAQHLHGGTGIDRDYYLWRYSLWARQLEATLGTSSELLARLGERVAAGEAMAG